MKRLGGLALLLAATACGGAAQPEPEVRTIVTFSARQDSGRALAGVALVVGGRAVNPTGPDGMAQAFLVGRDGASFPVAATCPAGHRLRGALSPVRLRRLQTVEPSASGLRYEITCERPFREVVVVVRGRREAASRGRGRAVPAPRASVPLEGVPVLVKGQPVTKTDENGLAYLLLARPPGQLVEVGLDTSAPALAKLVPASPVESFRVPEGDDVVTVERVFNEPPPPPVVRPRKKAAPPPKPIRIYEGGGDAPLIDMRGSGA